MGTFLVSIAAIALATAGQAPAPVKTASNTASLTFVSESRVLVGTAYGLDAIDAQPRVFGQRLAADLMAGHRTVWYSCPNTPTPHDGSRLTHNFEAGRRYELVCQAGKEAVIRQADEC